MSHKSALKLVLDWAWSREGFLTGAARPEFTEIEAVVACDQWTEIMAIPLAQGYYSRCAADVGSKQSQ